MKFKCYCCGKVSKELEKDVLIDKGWKWLTVNIDGETSMKALCSDCDEDLWEEDNE